MSNSTLIHNNAGSYQLWLADSNWTVVDQADYQYKPQFGASKVDDCVPNNADNTENTKAGCAVYSVSGNKTLIDIDFHPYQFNLDDVNVTLYPDDSKNYTFFNDLSNDYYDGVINLRDQMATSYVGNIVAEGKNSTILTNFTDTCAAQDVILATNIITNPSDVNATSPLQRYLHVTNNLNAAVDSYLGYETDRNLTLPSTGFLDNIDPGKAKILLHTTFKKSLDTAVNPLIANFKELDATSPNSFSSADTENNHIPDGNSTADRNVTYYFAKVTPKKDLYDDVLESWKETPIMVDIYCFDTTNPTSTLCADYGLATPSQGEDNVLGWYSATMFDGDNSDLTTDGTTDLSPETAYGVSASPIATPSNDIEFDDGNGTQNDINISLQTNDRPTVVDVRIEPVPWLRFDANDPNGFPHYRIKFIGPSAWIGVGNRGDVVEGASNANSNRRMNW